jgi:hypothetical protein
MLLSIIGVPLVWPLCSWSNQARKSSHYCKVTAWKEIPDSSLSDIQNNFPCFKTNDLSINEILLSYTPISLIERNYLLRCLSIDGCWLKVNLMIAMKGCLGEFSTWVRFHEFHTAYGVGEYNRWCNRAENCHWSGEVRWCYFTTDGHSFSMSWYRASVWDLRPDITSCRNVGAWNLRSCFCGAPSLTLGRVCNLQYNQTMVRVARFALYWFVLHWKHQRKYNKWASSTVRCCILYSSIVHEAKLIFKRFYFIHHFHFFYFPRKIHCTEWRARSVPGNVHFLTSV